MTSSATPHLHCYQDGPPDAPALLLIHGTAASGRSWEPILEFLTPSHRVVRVDLAGSGRSSAADDGSYAVQDQAARVAAELDRLGIEHALVAGHSSGGVFATALAEQRPELVDGLFFFDTGPHLAAYIATEVPLRAGDWSALGDDQIRDAIRDGFAPGFDIPKAYVDQFREIDLHAFAATSQAVIGYLTERSLPDRLAPLGKPLSVLFGADDQRWDPAAADDYRSVPGATVELLPRIGHSPNLEDPELAAQRLLAFADDLAGIDRSPILPDCGIHPGRVGELPRPVDS